MLITTLVVSFVGTPTLQFSFFHLHTNPHTDQDNSSLTTTANHSHTASSSVYFHEQRKRPLASGTISNKPRPPALPTNQWQSRLTSSDLYKKRPSVQREADSRWPIFGPGSYWDGWRGAEVFLSPASEPQLTTPDEVHEAIRGLNVSKAPGPYGIPNRGLKHLS